jgi:hypothetical protein
MLTLEELVPILTDTPPLYMVTCVHPPVARPRDLPASEADRPAVPYMVNEFDKGNHTNNPLERLLRSCRRPVHYAEYITSAHCCTCQFSITQGYPYRHMWRVLSVQNILQISTDMFHPRFAAFSTLSITVWLVITGTCNDIYFSHEPFRCCYRLYEGWSIVLFLA